MSDETGAAVCGQSAKELNVTRWIILILLISFDLMAGSPRLFNLESQSAMPEEPGKGLLPERVYMVQSESDQKWYFALTTGHGDLVKPYEFFRSGSVLSGRYFAAKSWDQNYILNNQGIWEPSFQKEQQYYWVFSSPPRIKIVGFREAPQP